MNKKRLNQLADYLDTVPPEMFDMYWWGIGEEYAKETGQCGASACAFGHAAMLWPQHLEMVDDDSLPGAAEIRHKASGKRGFSAAKSFFGINRRAASYLFNPYSYAKVYRQDPIHVAGRIRDYVRNGMPDGWIEEE